MTQATAADMELRDLLPGLVPAPPPLDVADIATHSGEVVPGGLFLACAGTRDHGLRFLDDALRHGAAAVAWEPGVEPPTLPEGIVGFPVPGLGRELGSIANRWFASPSADLAVTGITGTNGKTTVAWLLAQALGFLGRRPAYMGTLGFGLGTEVRPDALTTPGCVTVHRRLRALADAGATHVAAEVSSHALDQGRVDGVSFRVVAFTNLSRDHLDYHGDLERYGAAKARLIVGSGAAHAVVNVGDAFGRRLAEQVPTGTRLLSVAAGEAVPATLRAVRLSGAADGQRVRLATADASVTFDTGLLGDFNVENVAVAAGVLLADGHELAEVAGALARCSAPPGRMERIEGGRGPRVVVDFAHTPDALARALEALRPHAAGRLWCVFGCGGERDAGKRALMGAVARRLADRVVVTDDNPRREDPHAIIAEVLSGAGGGAAVEIVRDRALAIRHAIATAAVGDLVLIAGKGHERTQTVGTEARPFSDQAVARDALGDLR